MTIDKDVAAVARFFGAPSEVLQAVVNAEGNILRAVQCSLPSVQTREKALEVLARSYVHAISDYVKHRNEGQAFIAFWAQRWAPEGAANDPTHLNSNWVGNVTKLSGWIA